MDDTNELEVYKAVVKDRNKEIERLREDKVELEKEINQFHYMTERLLVRLKEVQSLYFSDKERDSV